MSIVDEVKQRLDIVEFINSYVPLQKAGRNHKGLCPFHSEKTPSFIVFPDSQSWHCFGACATGGDIFGFVMRRENMEFGEALRLLAERAGLELRPLDAAELQHRDEVDRLRAVNAEAAQFYHHLLGTSAQAEGARRYLQKRGVTRETTATFQLGYAPDEWHALEPYLVKKGHKADDILAAGLTTEGERGNVYDRFRGRLIFPIRDVQGHVIGFGGRALDDDTQPKYLNSPQTPLFDKGSVLYGINLSRDTIRESDAAIIVEGYMDVVIPHQCGIKNVVACMGTALSAEQLDILKRVTRRFILALDPDAAGLRAVEKGVQTAQETLDRKAVPVPTATGLIRYEEQLQAEIRILTLPDGLDPDELVLQDRERWDRLVAEALPVAEYFYRLVLQQVDLGTARGKREAVDRLMPVLAAMDNAVERTHYLQRLAQHVHVDERQLAPELERVRTGRASKARTGSGLPARASGPGLSMEERCLALLLAAPALLAEMTAMSGLSEQAFQDERNRQLFRILSDTVSAGEPTLYDGRAMLAALRAGLDTELGAHVESLLQRLGSDPPLSTESLREDLAKTSARLCKGHLSRLIRELRFLQQDAQEQDNPERVRELSQVIEGLTHEYLRIDQRYHAVTMQGRREGKEKAISYGPR